MTRPIFTFVITLSFVLQTAAYGSVKITIDTKNVIMIQIIKTLCSLTSIPTSRLKC